MSIRGVGGSPNTDVLMAIDGRPDFQGEMGHTLSDFYSLSNTGSILVIKVLASVLYGSNVMGEAPSKCNPANPTKARNSS